jgi:hypothetical protein
MTTHKLAAFQCGPVPTTRTLKDSISDVTTRGPYCVHGASRTRPHRDAEHVHCNPKRSVEGRLLLKRDILLRVQLFIRTYSYKRYCVETQILLHYKKTEKCSVK